jgi:hypothetical protein
MLRISYALHIGSKGAPKDEHGSAAVPEQSER